jgi:hypothetical protein
LMCCSLGGGEGLDVSLPLSDVVRADHEMWWW